MIWNAITNPDTGRKVSIYGIKGQNILHKYLQQFNNTIQNGGSNKTGRKTGPKSFHIEHNVPLLTDKGDLISEKDILMLKELKKQKEKEAARIIKIKEAKIKRDLEKQKEKARKLELKKQKEREKLQQQKEREDAIKKNEQKKKLEEEEFRKKFPDKAAEIDRLKRKVRKQKNVYRKKNKKKISNSTSFLPSAGQVMTLAVLRKIANKR
jgi:hypothetical protein